MKTPLSKTGLEYALHRVHQGESDMVEHLLRLSEKHSAEHEVHHVASELAGWSRLNLAALAEAARQYDVDLDREPDQPGFVRRLVDSGAAHMPGKVAGLALLEDLRDVYLVGSETSLAWEMLAQHAQARRERDLLSLTARCHPQTLRQIRWANTMIKTLSPQVLSSLDA
jgi:hypothetical protein